MRKSFLIIGMLFGVLVAPSTLASEDTCPSRILTFFVRETSPTGRLLSALETFSGSFTIQELQRIEIEHFQSAGKKDRTYRKEFHPFWILKNSEALELLVYGFPEAFYFSKAGEERSYYGVYALFKKWRDLKKSADSAEWQNSKKRDAFLRLLILEIVYGYQRSPVNKMSQPVNFVRQEDNTYSVLAGSAEITDLFGSVDAFKSQFLDFKRKRDEQRTPHFPQVSKKPSPRTKTAKGLKDLTQKSAPKVVHPQRDEDRRVRSQEEWIDLGVSIIEKAQEKRNPLARLVLDSSTGDNPFEMALNQYDLFVELFKTFGNYTEAVDRKLPQQLKLRMGRGVKTWTQELMIQLADEYVLRTAPEIGNFTGFQAEDSSEPYYIVSTNRLFMDAQLSIKQLQDHVLLRRQSLYRN